MIWWPVALGILVTPVARRAADVLAMEGPSALQTLYPWVALLKLRALHLPEDLSDTLSQVMMYLQFPLYGLFMALILRRYDFVRAFMATVLLHSAPLLFLIAINRP